MLAAGRPVPDKAVYDKDGKVQAIVPLYPGGTAKSTPAIPSVSIHHLQDCHGTDRKLVISVRGSRIS